MDLRDVDTNVRRKRRRSMLREIGLISLIVVLGGCAGSPIRIGMMSPEALRAESSYNLCIAYYSSKLGNAKAELIRRNAIPDDEWPVIEQSKIRIGMSELGLVCSWGYPRTSNKTVTRYGESKQWVYSLGAGYSGQYVYIENGKVTSWQTN